MMEDYAIVQAHQQGVIHLRDTLKYKSYFFSINVKISDHFQFITTSLKEKFKESQNLTNILHPI